MNLALTQTEVIVLFIIHACIYFVPKLFSVLKKKNAFFSFLKFISFSLQKYVIDSEIVRGKIRRCLKRCWPSQDLAYHKIESEIKKDPTWPPVSDTKVGIFFLFIFRTFHCSSFGEWFCTYFLNIICLCPVCEYN